MKKNIICAFLGLMLLSGLYVDVQAMQKNSTNSSEIDYKNFVTQMKKALKQKKRLKSDDALILLQDGVDLFFSSTTYKDVFKLISNQDFLELNFPAEYSRYVLIDSQLNDFLVWIVKSKSDVIKLSEILRAIFFSKYFNEKLTSYYIQQACIIAHNKGLSSIENGLKSIINTQFLKNQEQQKPVYDEKKFKEACAKLKNIR